MMKERYFSVDGQMIGYESPVGRRDYLYDSIGSVTAEIDQSGNDQLYAARYKPFGNNESSIGSPGRFTWLGTLGYRSNELLVQNFYVRSRHYSVSIGAWTSVDPEWPDEPAYVYSRVSPLVFVDPSGKSPGDEACFDLHRSRGPCDNWNFLMKFLVDCSQKGSYPCLTGAGDRGDTGECATCCSICYPACEDSIKAGGVLCAGDRRSDVLKCAKDSLRHLRPDTLDGKNPKVDEEGLSCPKHFGIKGTNRVDKTCVPPGASYHITWRCTKKKGEIKQKVISSVCCRCYYKGVIRLVCYNNEGCHTNKL